jgi:uncharacterized protein YggT (Ycf19 family)
LPTARVIEVNDNPGPGTGRSTGQNGRDHDALVRAPIIVVRVLGYLTYAYLIVVEVILGLAFILRLLGANPTSDFVTWIYRSADRAMNPFRGIFEPIQLGTSRQAVPAVFDTSFLFAMLIYGIVAIVIHMGLTWLGGQMHRLDANRVRQERLDAYSDAAESYRSERPDVMSQRPDVMSQPADDPNPTTPYQR